MTTSGTMKAELLVPTGAPDYLVTVPEVHSTLDWLSWSFRTWNVLHEYK